VSPEDSTSGVRRILLFAILAATALKLVLAATTLGTDDVRYWAEFEAGVREFGPIGIYGQPFVAQYNHGPLAGWWLATFDLGTSVGLSVPFLVRVPASLADAVTAWILYRLVRERTTDRAAALVAAGVVWSPVLVTISGYHGNTDPVFVALVLAAFLLLTRQRRPLWAGVCLAAAVSLKLVPLVTIPWLLYLAWKAGRASLVRFVLGGAVVFAVLWVPVMLLRWTEFEANVLSYQGIWLREWGVAEIVERMGHPAGEFWLAEHGQYVVLLAALVPFLVARGRDDGGAVGLGLTLTTFLLLTPAFGMQYLAWALAPAVLVSLAAAWTYNVAASVFVLVVYTDWSDAPPWHWEVAFGMPFTPTQLQLMLISWACLLLVVLAGSRDSILRAVRMSAKHDGGREVRRKVHHDHP
jgi:hypothetical protein